MCGHVKIIKHTLNTFVSLNTSCHDSCIHYFTTYFCIVFVEVRGQFLGVGFLLLLCGPRDWNSGHLDWQQVSLSTEPSLLPPVCKFKSY